MIEYYEYETSPRKLEPDYQTNIRKKKKTVVKRKTNTKAQTRNNIKTIFEVVLGFAILLLISYR